jgi:hypothetical protein
MSITITQAKCRKCGKPLEKIPSYLAKGDGERLFECDACFYPGCATTRLIFGREKGSRRGRLEGIVEDFIGTAAK